MSYLELDIPGRRALVALSSGVVHATQGRIGAEDIGMPNWFARYRLKLSDIAGLDIAQEGSRAAAPTNNLIWLLTGAAIVMALWR